MPPLAPPAAAQGFGFADPAAIGLALAGMTVFVAVGALTNQHERAFSAAVVYLTLGALASLALRPLGVELLDPLAEPRVLERLSELAVIVALFGAGLRLDRRLSWAAWRSVAVLLAIVMPLTIAAITLWGSQVMGLSLGAAAILGAVLAPTDPVLAGDVSVGPPGEGNEPEPRFALTAEAGLNDGLAFPFVLLGMFVAREGSGGGWLGEWLVADLLYGVLAGVALGVLVGSGAAAAVLRLRGRGVLSPSFDGWLAVGTVLLVYGTTEAAGGYGFLAAFVAGLAFRRRRRDDQLHGTAHAGIEHVEKFGELALVLLVGSAVTVGGLAQPGLMGWLLAPVLLLVVRPALCVAALAPLRLPLGERGFVGWFGIRGIGSFYYVAVALGAGVLSAAEAASVFWTVVAVSCVSIVLNGVSAGYLTRRVVDRCDRGLSAAHRSGA